MYCDKWENWADYCRDNTDRSCKADSLKDSCEDSADNADRLNEADSSDDEDDSDDLTAWLMTVSVMRLIADCW